MVPTLLVGDYLFVSKFSYGYSRYSLPFGVCPTHSGSGRIFFRAPQRGDVVVFKLPCDPSTDFIKRIIGLPGDRIQMKNGVLNINDAAGARAADAERLLLSRCVRAGFYPEFIETLTGEIKMAIAPRPIRLSIRSSRTADPPSSTTRRDFTVPPGHYFMMGDNRDNSADSRDPDERRRLRAGRESGRPRRVHLLLDRRLCPWWSRGMAVHDPLRPAVLGIH